MRITMKALASFSDGSSLEAGKSYEVERGRAKALIGGGYAVPEADDPATKSAEEREARPKRTRGAAKGKTTAKASSTDAGDTAADAGSADDSAGGDQGDSGGDGDNA